jgi:hypothetical protein
MCSEDACGNSNNGKHKERGRTEIDAHILGEIRAFHFEDLGCSWGDKLLLKVQGACRLSCPGDCHLHSPEPGKLIQPVENGP